MGYLFESLGDERFQEFCNALIAKKFPDFQSFPVGQPDGGRDSLVYNMTSSKKNFLVFQVKYVRNPDTISDVHKWLTNIIKEEAPKIAKLIPKGAKKFYLLTNVRGTGHLDVGSKDVVNSILEREISIPSICWWRDDLGSLVDGDPIFKWSFPEIITGQDVLNAVLFEGIQESKERRESIIRAYLVDQYAIDNEVKFKQIDLQNKLFDLFTDVPIKVKKLDENNRSLKRTIEYFDRYTRKEVHFNEMLYIEAVETLGAANFLLHPKVQNEIERVLLEGGPGQGKSTISQYICQVHRVRLLKKDKDIDLIPDVIKQSPVRLPFKFDLRHIAMWVESKNPYQSRLAEEYFKQIWKNSLESFIIGHVIYHSQIDSFTIDDLLAILKNSFILFVFDGFDEIADLKVRKDVIEFINKGVNRIRENSRSLQIVITSRPAAFYDTIGFSVDEYPHFQLTDITSNTISEYVDKWVKISRLDSRESAEIKRLVDEKLQLPHLKDLAKSPMQLAIFISLLRTRGESLPNKRTALYDSYIDLFFNRESEKNSTIRDHRDLIIDIHQYLAWILHSEAELFGNSGSIGIEELKNRLKTYLLKEGHKTDIADQLFHVLQERVCALVSRVQGTYEFEVQPLREYFCAQYLYNTAPYSPAGKEKRGTKPDRFNAIARNFYWNNVVRFFAGSFDKGELPMLIQELKSLQQDSLLRYTNYPSLITSQILSDWVFTQYPILLKDVVKIIVESINIGGIFNQDEGFINSEMILLPNECGRQEVFDECFAQLKEFPKNDYANELISVLKNNPMNTFELWSSEVDKFSNEKLVKWLEYAYLLQIIHRIDSEVLGDVIMKDSLVFQYQKIQIVLNASRNEIIDKNVYLKECYISGILNLDLFSVPKRNGGNILQYFGLLFNPYLLQGVLRNENLNLPFVNHLVQRYDDLEFQQFVDSDLKENDSIDDNVTMLLKLISPVFGMPISTWKNSVRNWDLIVEHVRTIFGENWAIKSMAIISAGVKSKEEVFDDHFDLVDKSTSLCKRVRCARMKSGNINYWDGQFKTSEDIIFKLIVFFTWATPKSIIALHERIESIINEFSDEEKRFIVRTLRKCVDNSVFTNRQSNEMVNFCKRIKNSFLNFIISLRINEGQRIAFIYKHIDDSLGSIIESVYHHKYHYLVDKYLDNYADIGVLSSIKKYYSLIKNHDFSDEYVYHRVLSRNSARMSTDHAIEIVSNIKLYPRGISSIAERSLRHNASESTVAVGKVAAIQKWFE